MRTSPFSFAPIRNELSSYSFSIFGKDLGAAAAVALLTIPQSIAYSLLAGLPPTAGIFSAIFGTIFSAAFGSSRYLVSGPSTGVAILLQSSLAEVLLTTPNPSEAQTLYLLAQLVLLVGVVQIVASFLNVSKALQFVSRPVLLGYFSGIAFAIIVNQLFYFLGIATSSKQPILLKAATIFKHIGLWDWASSLVGMIALATYLVLKRAFKAMPYPSLLTLVVAAAAAWGIHSVSGIQVATLRDYSDITHLAPHWELPAVDWHTLNQLFPAAVAIAFLSMLEVFSVSRHFAALSGQPILVNQDVFGVGVGNFALAFVSGTMPASGSATRTTLNYQLHAQTRIAALCGGLLTAIILYFCWSWVQIIPLAALAALLIATAPTLVNGREIGLAFRATREDAWVFALTLGSCVIFDLDVAFFIGIAISLATYLRKSSVPHLVEYAFNSKGRLVTVNPKSRVNRKIRIIGIGGELYFAAADVFQAALQSIAGDRSLQVIVLRLNNVYHMDGSMCLAIAALNDLLKVEGRHLIISGLTEEVWRVLHRAGLVKQIGLDNLYFTDESNPQFSTWKACARAQELLAQSHS